jgi:hypothetical protein
MQVAILKTTKGAISWRGCTHELLAMALIISLAAAPNFYIIFFNHYEGN